MTRVSLRLLVSGLGLLLFSSQTAIAGHEGLTYPALPARATAHGAHCSHQASRRGWLRYGGVQARRGACSALAQDDDDESDLSIYDYVEECSPFSSVDGTRQLDFDSVTGAVTLEDNSADLPSAASDTTPGKAVGTFAADEDSEQVSVRIAGATRQYTLVVPTDGGQCILAAGATESADLNRSWFGAVEEDPELPDESGPKMTGAHARVTPGFSGSKGRGT